MRAIIALFLLIIPCIIAGANSPDKKDNGAIKGTVIDKSNKEPLIGATVRIEGQSMGSITDLDGNFQIEEVTTGEVILIISYISYNTLRVEEVVIKPNEITTIEVALDASTKELQEFVVTARANRESENILLLEQKQSLLAVKAMGARELSRKGISNAEAAVAQISGVSKQEGVKNVFIRGLGDRYNATYLNGFPIPSDDPEYKNIALDMFDTDIIQNISVQKAFSATHGGDVGGAVIDITSKELYGERQLSISGGIGANTSVITNTFYKQDGTNYFGVSNATEPVSGSFARGVTQPTGTEYPFANRLQPEVIKAPINHSLSASAGKLFEISENNKLSMFLVANHSVGYAHTERISRALSPIGTWDQDLKGPNSSIETRQMGFGNILLNLNQRHQIEYNLLAIHSNNQYVAQLTGMDNEKNQETGLVKMYRQQANENLLIVNQLDSYWTFTNKLKFNIGTSFNLMRAKEPDRRILYLKGSYLDDEDIVWNSMASDRNDRFYSKLRENDLNIKGALEWKLKEDTHLRLGYIGRFVDHSFSAREYNHSSMRGIGVKESEFEEKMNWDKLFYNSENLQTESNPHGFQLIQSDEDWYNSSKLINSAYLELTTPITEKLSSQVSLRTDFVYFTVKQGKGSSERSNSKIRKTYLLPAINIKYDINEQNVLRLSTSRTYTLPQVKEISPYQYINIGYVSFGNPEIKPSDLWNVDLKWDCYISAGEILSTTLFYKYIQNPIARIDNNVSSGAQEYTNPSDKVNIVGIELEGRKTIVDKAILLSAKRHKLDLGISGSYIMSQMYLNTDPDNARHTMLEGSSPWLLNTDITYTYTKGQRDITATILLSYFSDRIHTYGSRGITKSGLQNDLIEEGIATLNFIASAEITPKLSLKLKANNLLDTPYRCTLIPNESAQMVAGDQPITISEYHKGISLSLGLTWQL